MPAKKSSPKLLPADLYESTEGDKQRAKQEEKFGMVTPEHPVLTRLAQAVDPKLIKSPFVQDIVGRLLTAAGAQQATGKKVNRMLVGLAAPQIGESWRIMVVDTKVTADRKNNGRLEVFINPELVWRSREAQEGREGCFSVGPVYGLVRRSIAVKIKAFTPGGIKVERILEGFTARIVQHEIDHLNGIRFPERITSDKKRHWVHAEELPVYPKNIHHWHRICTNEQWVAISSGRPL